MSKKHFTEKEIKTISKNPYIKSVSTKGITYKDEFKRMFIAENENGKLPRQILEENGFDVEVLGIVRVNRAANKWRTAITNQEYQDFEICVERIQGDQLRKSVL
ncbi:hypothetical protein QFZ73_000422 [Peribacillus sp. V2I11]|nr:hypothetical protein [Peribacillus sp. V2I11]